MKFILRINETDPFSDDLAQFQMKKKYSKGFVRMHVNVDGTYLGVRVQSQTDSLRLRFPPEGAESRRDPCCIFQTRYNFLSRVVEV